MTSRQLEKLNLHIDQLVTMYGPMFTTGTPDDRREQREVLIAWVANYGQAQRREGRKDVAGRTPRKAAERRGALTRGGPTT